MAKNIVAVKQIGLLIADGWLSRAVKDAGYLGTAVVHEGSLVINHQPAKPTVESIQKVQEHFKDSVVIFCFGENAKTQLEEDRLPFLCQLGKDKADEAAVFLTGSFEGYAVKGSSHIPEYHAFDDYISKKLQKVYKGAGSDIEEFLKELNDPVIQQEISHSWTNRGFISILASNGKQSTVFNKGNVFAREYPWGVVSDGLGYEEKPVTTPAPEPAKELSLLEKLKLKSSGKEPAASVPPVAPPKSDTSKAAIEAAVSTEHEEVSLPPEAKSWVNKQKRSWWIAEIGYAPNNYKELRTKVMRFKGTKKGIYAHLVDANGNLPAVINQNDFSTGLPDPQPQKITDSTAMDHKEEVKVVKAENPNKVDPKALPDKKEAPENAKDTAPKHVSADNLPILTPKQKLLLKKDFLADKEIVKILGDDFQSMVVAPKNLKEMEDSYAPFWDSLGMEPHFMTKEALLKLGTLDLQALATFAFHAQLDAKKAELKLASIEKANPNLKLAM